MISLSMFFRKLVSMRNFCAAVLVIVSLAACSDSTPPKSLSEVGDNVHQISDQTYAASPGALIVDLKRYTHFSQVANESAEIFQNIKVYFPEQFDSHSTVWVMARTDLVDKYGNKSNGRFFGIEWQTSELKKARLTSDGITSSQLLNLASNVRVFNRAGSRAVGTYCQDKENYQYSQDFCSKFGSQ